MAEKARCEICNRNFKDEAGLAMHTAAKHSPSQNMIQKRFSWKKIRSWSIGAGCILLLILGVTASLPDYEVSVLNVERERLETNAIPLGAVHWHPRLTIIIDGEKFSLPEGLGHQTGRIIDTALSGMGMSPLHTHQEKDGTIHLENNNPNSNPETVTIGYFFYVWDKAFNSTCIFDYCTDKGTLKMTVNGKENTEFQNYIMKDNDVIKIEYKSQ